MEKELKLNVRKFLGLNPTFVEVTGEKLVGGSFLHPILNRVNITGAYIEVKKLHELNFQFLKKSYKF